MDHQWTNEYILFCDQLKEKDCFGMEKKDNEIVAYYYEMNNLYGQKLNDYININKLLHPIYMNKVERTPFIKTISYSLKNQTVCLCCSN